MPDLSEFEGCFIADRSGMRSKINSVKGKKLSTRISVFESLIKARRYIDDNFSDSILLEDLSKFVCLSQSHLMREFKLAFNQSIYEYLTERRMAYARHLLITTNFKIIMISQQCGYQSLGSFTSKFTTIHHQSPAKFRKQQNSRIEEIF